MTEVTKKYGIAEWRIDSDEERTLAKKADCSEEGKRQYVDFYRLNDPGYYEKGLSLIDEQIGHFIGPNITPEMREELVTDMVYSLHRFGCMFDEYFLFDYRHLNVSGRESFITDKTRYNYYDALNKHEYEALFYNKAETYRLYRKFYKREIIGLLKEDDFASFDAFCKRHERFIVKPAKSSCGHGVSIVRLCDYSSTEDLFVQLLSQGEMVVEELIEQVKEMAVLHPESVNTIRMPAVLCKSGIHLVRPFLKMGRGASVVDNGKLGGLLALIDDETGTVVTNGFDEFGNRFVRHPDTNVTINGFEIPYWNEAVGLVVELSKVLPDCRYIGWDMALTKEGWVVVEGNASGQFIAQQSAERLGLRDELKELIADW